MCRHHFHISSPSRFALVSVTFIGGCELKGLCEEFHVVIFNEILRRDDKAPGKTTCRNMFIFKIC